MAKTPKNSKAPANDAETVSETAPVVHPEQDAADREPRETASTPSGENGPDGTNTPSESSGDAAGEASAELVKPQDITEPTEAIPAQAENGVSGPEVEASASGINSTPSQGDAAEGAGANAGSSAVLSAEQANAILSQVLGVKITERRSFIVWKQVRFDNVLYARGDTVVVDETGHGVLAAARKVSPRWETGIVVEG